MACSRPLPQELIDYVVVELSGNWRSLEACSLTAKSFRGPSQKALFKTLTLYHGLPANTRLDDAMSSNTLLPTYVQTLRLKLAPMQDLMPVLRKLTSLRSLHIEGLVVSLPIQWQDIHPQLQQDVIYLVQSQTLEQFIFENISGFPLGILMHCPQLKDLQFLSSHRPEITSIDSPNEELLTRGHLESLTTVFSSTTGLVIDTLTDPRSRLSLSSLRRFNSMVSHSFRRDIVQFQRVLDYAARSLEIITVIILLGFVGFTNVVSQLINCADSSPGSMCLDLSGLNNLRVIHINTVDSVYISLHLAATMLDSIPKQNKLQDIKFTIVGVDCPSNLGQNDYDESWARLDSILTESTYLKIHRFLVIMKASTEEDEFRSSVIEKLPKLRSRGLMEMQFLS